MGAGSFNAGLGLAGHDPIDVPAPAVSTAIAGTALFDPLTKTYPLTTDGADVVEADPVWQEVAHRLGIPLGSLSFAPDVGIDLIAIKQATPGTAQRTVEDVVNRALAPMIAGGDVQVMGVDLALPWRGKWDVRLKNLRDPANDTDPKSAIRSFSSPT